jgi:hypothetical protein
MAKIVSAVALLAAVGKGFGGAIDTAEERFKKVSAAYDIIGEEREPQTRIKV